jgi:hypothetical protein
MEVQNTDVMLTLTINNTVSNTGIKNIITGKIIILNNINNINLHTLFKNLDAIKINKLSIFSISDSDVKEGFNFSFSENEYLYLEVGVKNFRNMLEMDNFLEYNKNSLYIFRGMKYYQIKNIITKIENCSVYIGRGSSQKSHILSPLEIRLTSYLMAMFNFNYKLISQLNMFNFLSKNFYLPTKI